MIGVDAYIHSFYELIDSTIQVIKNFTPFITLPPTLASVGWLCFGTAASLCCLVVWDEYKTGQKISRSSVEKTAMIQEKIIKHLTNENTSLKLQLTDKEKLKIERKGEQFDLWPKELNKKVDELANKIKEEASSAEEIILLEQFYDFVYRLQQSQDYKSNKPSFLIRLDKVITAAIKQSEFREQFKILMGAALQDCVDNTTVIFNEMEFHSKKEKYTNNPLKFAELAIRQQRVEEIKSQIHKDFCSNSHADQQDKFLFAAIHLNDSLNLSFWTKEMIFENLGTLKKDYLNELHHKILKINAKKLLSKSENWRKKLKSIDPNFDSKYKNLDEKYSNKMDQILSSGKRENIVKNGSEALIKEREKAFQKLTKKFTPNRYIPNIQWGPPPLPQPSSWWKRIF